MGEAVAMLFSVLYAFPRRREHFKTIVQHIYFYGNKTMMIVIVAGAFIGMVISLQGYTSLVRFGAESEIGGLTAYSIYRELGPVVTSLLFIGRVGSLLASEMSMMNINQQFTCLKMLAINAYQLVLFPRFLAIVISVPLLTIVFCLSAVLSSLMVCKFALAVSTGIFWNSLEYYTLFTVDVMHGFWKSLAFGFVIAWVAIYQGMSAVPNRSGMAKATTSTVVSASLLILGIDYVITALFGSML